METAKHGLETLFHGQIPFSLANMTLLTFYMFLCIKILGKSTLEHWVEDDHLLVFSSCIVSNLLAFLRHLELSAQVKGLSHCLVAQIVFLIFRCCHLNSSNSLVHVFLAVVKDLLPRWP